MNEPNPQSGVLTTKVLKSTTGIKRDANLKKNLESQGIACFDSPDGPWTTLELVKIAGMRKMGLPVSITSAEGEKKKWLE